MFVIKDCSCGGEPEIHVCRGTTLMKFTMCRDDKVVLKRGDILNVFCLQCQQEVEIEDRTPVKAKVSVV